MAYSFHYERSVKITDRMNCLERKAIYLCEYMFKDSELFCLANEMQNDSRTK